MKCLLTVIIKVTLTNQKKDSPSSSKSLSQIKRRFAVPGSATTRFNLKRGTRITLLRIGLTTTLVICWTRHHHLCSLNNPLESLNLLPDHLTLEVPGQGDRLPLLLLFRCGLLISPPQDSTCVRYKVFVDVVIFNLVVGLGDVGVDGILLVAVGLLLLQGD